MIVALAAALREGKITPLQAVEESLQKILALNERFPAFLTVDAEGARARARGLLADEKGPLWGVPVAVKDLALTRGLRTTFGSHDRAHFIPEMDSLVVERLQAAGAIIVGKTNTPEYGYKAVTDNALAPPLGNPWNRNKTSGGSSGGAAVAVALGMVGLAEGTDGAGSIRIPASFCGVAGFKPTFGRIPRFPIPDQYNTLSHTGLIANNVEDLALFFDVLAWPDERDPLCLTDVLASALEAVSTPLELREVHIGYSTDLGYVELDPAVATCFRAALDTLASAGADLTEADPGHNDPEALLQRLWEVNFAARFGAQVDMQYPHLGSELRAITEKGFKPSAWSLGQDAQERSRLYACYVKYFQEFDVLLLPTMPVPAFDIALQRPEGSKLFDWTPFTYPYNLTGLPALTIPMGRDEEGMPLGLQIVGRRGDDLTVLRVGYAVEKLLEGGLARPWQPDHDFPRSVR